MTLALAVVVAQLVERSLPTPEICGLNPGIGKFFINQIIYQVYHRKDENKEKEAGNGPSFKKGRLHLQAWQGFVESAPSVIKEKIRPHFDTYSAREIRTEKTDHSFFGRFLTGVGVGDVGVDVNVVSVVIGYLFPIVYNISIFVRGLQPPKRVKIGSLWPELKSIFSTFKSLFQADSIGAQESAWLPKKLIRFKTICFLFCWVYQGWHKKWIKLVMKDVMTLPSIGTYWQKMGYPTLT